MSRLGETFGQVLDEVADAIERREAAGLARYEQLLALIKTGEKVTPAQLRALGYYEGEVLSITAQMTTWQERASQIQVDGGISYGPVQLHAGFGHQSVSGSRDYVTVQAGLKRVIRTEGMTETVDALAPLPPLPTDGSLTLPPPALPISLPSLPAPTPAPGSPTSAGANDGGAAVQSAPGPPTGSG